MQLGVDVGGTFTDAVLLACGRTHTAKVPSTPEDQSEGVLAAVAAALQRAGAAPEDVVELSHGMTVGTNALLERRGARTALLATAGFTDLLEIARQDRVSLYHLCADRPPPLAPSELRIGVRERIGPAGVIEALSGEEVERVVARIGELDCESVAICLLFAFADPSHERRLAAAIREAYPGLPVSVSSEVLPRFREYERCSTTVIDAYLAPLLGSYLERLGERCRGAGLPEPTVMQSSGGVAGIAEAASGAAWSVLSGPAGGAVGAATVAAASEAPNVLGLDMGGTSCDVCVVADGEVRRRAGREIGGRPLGLPMVDVHTVGAGGGSIGWRDRGGALRVGPRSAGAVPGPACYGNGGEEPAVTDANLMLGYLPAEGRLAGGVELDPEAAERAVGRLGGLLGLSPIETAEGIVRVANQEMVKALRVVTVERGIDPRRFALLAFGGAGALHAAALARELEIDRIILPRTGGVLSALGLIAGERRRDVSRTVMIGADDLDSEAVRAVVEELSGAAAPDSRVEVTYEMRYRGQAFELDVAGTPDSDAGELREAFAAEHERRYGYRDEGGAVELVGVRLATIAAGDGTTSIPEVDPTTARRPAITERRARIDGEWHRANVIGGDPVPGGRLEGPAIVELAETTLLIPPRAVATVDGRGTIDVSLSGDPVEPA